MAALLNLPPELRLRVYEQLLSRHPYPIYVDEYDAKDSQPEWIQLTRLQKFDPALASGILQIYWRTNTFTLPENNGTFGIDGDSLKWMYEHVKDNLKDLRFVEFGFTSMCPSLSGDHFSSYCYNVVSVDIQREKAELFESGRRGDGCGHARNVVQELNTLLRNRPMVGGRRRMDENDFWALYTAAGKPDWLEEQSTDKDELEYDEE